MEPMSPGSRARTTSSSACRRPASARRSPACRRPACPRAAPVISLAKGLVPPHGLAPTILLRERFGDERVACIGGPAHAREMVTEGAGLVAASTNEDLARPLAGVFIRAGVVCEQSNDPIGVELAGAAKNAAGLAAGATEAQGLNAAGAAAGHIFAEVWRYADAQGARPESLLGLAGTGDLVATVLAPQSRNRRAGELLAAGVPAAEIPARIGQAVESLESVPLLARALSHAGLDAPVTDGAGEAHLRRAAARGLGRARAHDGPAVGDARQPVPPRGRPRPPPPGHGVTEAPRLTVGSSRTNSAPPPGALAAWTLPPCCSATWRTIASPSPEPGRRARRRRGRSGRRRAAGRSGSTPGPWSRTRSAPAVHRAPRPAAGRAST